MLSHDQEVCEYLNRLARMLGRVFGIDLGVDESGDKLVFVDADAEPIREDGEELIAATMEEVQNKMHVRDFFVRAGRAAAVAKYQEIERSRAP